jgi:hypothetical protein
MIPKTTLFVLCVLVALVGAQALPGCGEDDCDRAQDHLNECAPDTSTASSSSSSSSSSGSMLTCAGALECQSQCINNFTCPEINGLDPAFVTCMQACKGL